MRIKKSHELLLMWGFLNVNYVGIILFTVLWTATETIMDLPLIQKNTKMLSYQTRKMYKHRTSSYTAWKTHEHFLSSVCVLLDRYMCLLFL
jgi:hypothetical protein